MPASQLWEHVPSREETAASMALRVEKARTYQVPDSVTGFEADPVGVKEQERIQGGGGATGTWVDRGFSVLLNSPHEKHG